MRRLASAGGGSAPAVRRQRLSVACAPRLPLSVADGCPASPQRSVPPAPKQATQRTLRRLSRRQQRPRERRPTHRHKQLAHTQQPQITMLDGFRALAGAYPAALSETTDCETGRLPLRQASRAASRSRVRNQRLTPAVALGSATSEPSRSRGIRGRPDSAGRTRPSTAEDHKYRSPYCVDKGHYPRVLKVGECPSGSVSQPL